MITNTTQLFLSDESSLDATLFDPDHKLFLSFMLESDVYGIPIENVVEVKTWADIKIRPLVKAPPFLTGVFNLRGHIIPVVDLRIKWETLELDYSERTAIIILNISKRMWAVVVDSIHEVIGLKKDQILAAPTFNTKLDIRYFIGLANKLDHTVMLLDIERVMTSEEMGLIDNTQHAATMDSTL